MLQAIVWLHNGRAGALQGYSSEILRYATPESPAPPSIINPYIQAMFNEAYSSGKVPIQWQTALITPILGTLQAPPTTDQLQLGCDEALSVKQGMYINTY
ncbi:TPA: hypothetical protein ACH3X1_003323 [Trebouxia sp. C0004]